MKKEGVIFETDCKIGKDINIENIINENDAVILACGSKMPRLKWETRRYSFCDGFLPQQIERKKFWKSIVFLPKENTSL